MAESELKPTGFRLTKETQDKFREICKELGGNQQTAMAALIETYELEAGKQALPEQQTNIETFESYLRAASQMYRQSLENLQNMRALVRTEYAEELKNKDALLADLHKKLSEAEEAEKQAQKQLEEVMVEAEKTKKDYEKQMAALETKLTDVKHALLDSEQRREEEHAALRVARKSEDAFKEMFQNAQAESAKLRKEYDKVSSEYKISYDMVGKLTRERAEFEKRMGELEHQLEKQELEAVAQKEKAEVLLQLEVQKLENSLRKEYEQKIEEYRQKLEALRLQEAKTAEQEEQKEQERENS